VTVQPLGGLLTCLLQEMQRDTRTVVAACLRLLHPSSTKAARACEDGAGRQRIGWKDEARLEEQGWIRAGEAVRSWHRWISIIAQRLGRATQDRGPWDDAVGRMSWKSKTTHSIVTKPLDRLGTANCSRAGGGVTSDEYGRRLAKRESDGTWRRPHLGSSSMAATIACRNKLRWNVFNLVKRVDKEREIHVQQRSPCF
jgi:hypothetical protein